MTIRISADGYDVKVEHIKFSDGGSNLRIDWPVHLHITSYVSISVDPSTPVDAALFEILMARDFVRDMLSDGPMWEITRDLKFYLHLPYLPHGRADRRFEEGTATPLATFIKAVGPLFDQIFVTDPHSDVLAESLGDKLQIFHQADCFAAMKINTVDTFLVAPDKGAVKKIDKVAERHKSVEVIVADKVRDVTNGRITSITLPDVDLSGSRCVIVDDICDGGGTFIPLAHALRERGAKTIELYVTHGIFAQGLDKFKGVIDKLHVYQIVSNYISQADVDAFNSTNFKVQS